jgi:HD-GYP domain-containing protein (c-di-GMP phosphodiesterase class II)
MCAPLCSVSDTFGIIELDVRRPGTGMFTGKDVDRMAVFASYVAVVLDNHRLNLEQVRAFESTINALVHSLSLKDPDTARHSERVQKVAVIMGQEHGLAGTALEALSVAAILHDVGKQGVRDSILLKPAQLSDGERKEMAHHADLTQNILDRIAYPAHLKAVPLLAAYHHEKMNGSGHYRLAGKDIPIQSRIISVADAFDAIYSARVYKAAKPIGEVLEILDRGSGRDWDPEVLAVLKRTLPRIVATVYPAAPVEPAAGELDAVA